MHSRSVYLLVLVLLTCTMNILGNSTTTTTTPRPPSTAATTKLLLLGGNGLLGSAAMSAILSSAKSSEYEITLLNRGNWYWDTAKLIRPFVRHIRCTRGEGFRESCTRLQMEDGYDTIIDFSSYDPLDVEDILIVLGGKFRRYIYISTDSVYEVSKQKLHHGYMKEEDAVRPDDEATREALNKRDSYGDKKLACEEVLNRYRNDLNYEYIALRLPDVLGPRDNTMRAYKHFMYTKLHEIIGPIHIPKYVQNLPLSFVYSLDVGALVAQLVDPRYDSKVFNQAYNLAFKETITLKGLYTSIGNWLQHGETKFDESDNAHLIHGFPSVTRGPVDIGKAVSVLNWSPTGMETALSAVWGFYEQMQYSREYKFILDRVLDRLEVRGDKYRDFIELHYRNLKQEL